MLRRVATVPRAGSGVCRAGRPLGSPGVDDDRYGADVLAGSGSRPAAVPAPRRSRRDAASSSRTSRPAGAAPSCAPRRCRRAAPSCSRTGTGRPGPSRSGRGFWLDGAPVRLVAPARRRGAGRARADRVGSVAVHDAPRPRRPRQPDLRRGPARRRAGREGLGRRPARRGRRRRAARRRRRPRRRSCATSRPGPGRRLGVLVDHLVAGQQGVADRRRGSACPSRARARRRPPVRRRLAGGPAGSGWASPPGPRCPRGSRGRTASCAASAGRSTPGRRRAGWQRILRAVRQLRRPRAEPARPGRGAHRLRHAR